MNEHYPDFDEGGLPEFIAAPVKQATPFVAYLKRIGAGSLTFSLFVHLAFVFIAIFVIWFHHSSKKDEVVDFLPGGGGGTNGAHSKNENRRRQVVNAMPKTRIVSATDRSDVVIPDSVVTLQQLDNISNLTVGAGSLGKGGGKGGGIGTGTGRGVGRGSGPGNMPGFAGKFLGVPAAGGNIMFVIDTSGSMTPNCKPEGIEAIRRELGKTIRSMPSSTMFNIICFGAAADIFQPISVFATAENKAAAEKFFDYYYRGTRTRTERFGDKGSDEAGIAYVPVIPGDVKGLEGTSGGSRMDVGLTVAFQRQASTVFLLSDGEPGTQKDGVKMDLDALLDLIAAKRDEFNTGKTKTVVNTIAVNEEAEAFLKKVARRFDGKHKDVKVDKLKDKDNEKEKETDG